MQGEPCGQVFLSDSLRPRNKLQPCPTSGYSFQAGGGLEKSQSRVADYQMFPSHPFTTPWIPIDEPEINPSNHQMLEQSIKIIHEGLASSWEELIGDKCFISAIMSYNMNSMEQ
jgi:hypothetical protein